MATVKSGKSVSYAEFRAEYRIACAAKESKGAFIARLGITDVQFASFVGKLNRERGKAGLGALLLADVNPRLSEDEIREREAREDAATMAEIAARAKAQAEAEAENAPQAGKRGK